jgi:hypothetical protein
VKLGKQRDTMKRKLTLVANKVTQKKDDATKPKKIFGEPFDRESDQIPPVIRRVVEYFDEKGSFYGLPLEASHASVPNIFSTGVEIEGLFRISGSTAEVQKYKNLFDAGTCDQITKLPPFHLTRVLSLGMDPDLKDLEDPHACAALLKLYLRELPDPLLTFELYDCFLAASCKNMKSITLHSSRYSPI